MSAKKSYIFEICILVATFWCKNENISCTILGDSNIHFLGLKAKSCPILFILGTIGPGCNRSSQPNFQPSQLPRNWDPSTCSLAEETESKMSESQLLGDWEGWKFCCELLLQPGPTSSIATISRNGTRNIFICTSKCSHKYADFKNVWLFCGHLKWLLLIDSWSVTMYFYS